MIGTMGIGSIFIAGTLLGTAIPGHVSSAPLEQIVVQEKASKITYPEQYIDNLRKYEFNINNREGEEVRRYVFFLNEAIDPQIGSNRAEDYRLQQIVVRDGPTQGTYSIIEERKDGYGRRMTPIFKFTDGKGFTTGSQMIDSIMKRDKYAPVGRQLGNFYNEYIGMLNNWLKSRN